MISESSTHGTIFSSLDSNKEITLKCKFDGFPVPELKFQFAGVNLNSISNASGFVSYKFRVTKPRDFGFYSCVAENKMGTVTHYIEVYERGEFKFLKTRLIKVMYSVKKTGTELPPVLPPVLPRFHLLTSKDITLQFAQLEKNLTEIFQTFVSKVECFRYTLLFKAS